VPQDELVVVRIGPESLAGALLREAGLAQPVGAPAGYGGYVPLEKLIMLRPDFLVMTNIVETADGQGALYLTHPALRALYPPEKRIVSIRVNWAKPISRLSRKASSIWCWLWRKMMKCHSARAPVPI